MSYHVSLSPGVVLSCQPSTPYMLALQDDLQNIALSAFIYLSRSDLDAFSDNESLRLAECIKTAVLTPDSSSGTPSQFSFLT